MLARAKADGEPIDLEVVMTDKQRDELAKYLLDHGKATGQN